MCFIGSDEHAVRDGALAKAMPCSGRRITPTQRTRACPSIGGMQKDREMQTCRTCSACWARRCTASSETRYFNDRQRVTIRRRCTDRGGGPPAKAQRPRLARKPNSLSCRVAPLALARGHLHGRAGDRNRVARCWRCALETLPECLRCTRS
jgi:hypothetical protein